MVSVGSTLVETVSINYEDFNESFLTCGTCLCVYDGAEHTPKLLPCSHTICLDCLSRIASTHSREIGAFRCPICRELITIPRGGIAALPPSFLVNQLLDLMSRQRRHIIPNCSEHTNQELLFCETCDLVFCSLCTSGSSHIIADPSCTSSPTNTNNSSSTATSSSNANCEHTIIPFSIAIKRMSEILLYKANECLTKLTKAKETVEEELDNLEKTNRDCLAKLDRSFHELRDLLQNRRLQLISQIQESKDSKKTVLEEQLNLIAAERTKVEEVCEGLQYQVEVRTISQRVASLSVKLDSVTILGEPRENSYIDCDINKDNRLAQLKKMMNTLGKVVTTTTLPSLSTVHVEDMYVMHLEARATVKTVDYHGNPRTSGGDPVKAVIKRVEQPGLITVTENTIEDLDNGTYNIRFRPQLSGRYCINVSILGRPIKNCEMEFTVIEHNNPVQVHGSRGIGKDEYLQPVSVAIDNLHNLVYVLDTGNSRIKVLTPSFAFVRHIENPGLLGRSCTGISVYVPSNRQECWIAVVNWRSKTITRMNIHGDTIDTFSHNLLKEPIDVAVTNDVGNIFVADVGSSSIFGFNCKGDLITQVGKLGCCVGTFNMISSICIGPNNELIVADKRLQVFSSEGKLLKEILPDGNNHGRYGGVAMDKEGMLLASRTDKSRQVIQVFSVSNYNLVNVIDSYNNKLKRPSGIATTLDKHVIVVDLGNDRIKKYRYW